MTEELELGASYLRNDVRNGVGQYNQNDLFKLETTYRLASGLYATATYTNNIVAGNGGNILAYGLSVGFNFGDGTTFG